MSLVPSSLHTRLSLALFTLLLVFGAAEFYTLYRFFIRMSDEASETAAASLVEYAARSLEPVVRDDVRIDEAYSFARTVQRIIPDAGLYVVDRAGQVLLNLSPTGHLNRTVIDPEPLIGFADRPVSRRLPMYGDEPAEGPGNVAPFASAPLIFRGRDAILYLSLGGAAQRRLEIFSLDAFLPRYIVVVSLVLILGVSASGAVLFARITRRFYRLAEVLRCFHRQEYSARANLPGSDELADLGRVVDGLGASIAAATDEIADRDKQRRELIAGISHDLRGPAALIKSYTELLVSRPSVSVDSDASAHCGTIASCSTTLMKLVAQLFELAKLEAREEPLNAIPFVFDELADEILSTYRKSAAARSITLTQSAPDEPREVRGDPALLSRVLSNLIENALTYTPDGGSVEVRLTRGVDRLKVEVADTGVGISEDDLPRVFEPAFRAKKWEGRRPDSGGLGLAIVKRIVEAHGSRIEVSSQEYRGSCFAFDLPWA